MAGRGGARPGAGRTKGGKNSGLPATTKLAKSVGGSIGTSKISKGPKAASPGISPKDLLLHSMRSAWDAAYFKGYEAEQIEKEIIKLRIAKAPETDIDKLERAATSLRLEAGVHLTRAQEIAKDVAPFEHPKLANTDSKIAGALTVTIKQYPINQQPAPKVAVAVKR